MTEVRALLDPDDVARLRDALGSADFTVAGIAERIGTAGVAGVRRRDFRALLRATADRDRLSTLLRLFAGDQTEAAGRRRGGLGAPGRRGGARRRAG